MRSFFEGAFPYTGNRGSLAPLPSDTIDARVLVAATAEKHTVPTGATFVIFSATGDFYAKFGDTNVVAAVPSADVLDGSASELNPAARRIPTTAGFVSLVAAAACTVTMAFYQD